MKLCKRIINILIALIFISSVIGCQSANKKVENKALKILVDNSYTDDIDALKLIIENYKKSHNDVVIETTYLDNTEKIKTLVEEKKDYDILICNRDLMLYMINKALISDVTNTLSENKTMDKFYNIALSYGRKGDKYYGIGVLPCSIELIYNKNMLPQILNTKEVKGIEDIGRAIKEKNINIPVVLPKDIDLDLAISSLIGNNIIDNAELEKNYDASKEKYLSISTMQDLFTFINSLYKNYGITKDSFIISNSSVLNKIDKGELPLALVTSSILKNIDQNSNIEIFNGNIKTSLHINPLIVINHVICLLENGVNKSEMNKFIDYICKDETYDDLAKNGIITTNKKSNNNFKGTSNKIIATLMSGNENSIPYYLNLPIKFKKQLVDEVDKVLRGQYDGQEWQRILNKNY